MTQFGTVRKKQIGHKCVFSRGFSYAGPERQRRAGRSARSNSLRTTLLAGATSTSHGHGSQERYVLQNFSWGPLYGAGEALYLAIFM